MHAVMGMLKIPKSDRDSTVLEFLGSLMEKLEADRQNVELDAENDAERVRNFALNVFVSADNDDQRGKNVSYMCCRTRTLTKCIIRFRDGSDFPCLYDCICYSRLSASIWRT